MRPAIWVTFFGLRRPSSVFCYVEFMNVSFVVCHLVLWEKKLDISACYLLRLQLSRGCLRVVIRFEPRFCKGYVLWDVTPCRGGGHLSACQRSIPPPYLLCVLRMRAVGSSETSVRMYRCTLRHGRRHSTQIFCRWIWESVGWPPVLTRSKRTTKCRRHTDGQLFGGRHEDRRGSSAP
jgi:hypothetical protein